MSSDLSNLPSIIYRNIILLIYFLATWGVVIFVIVLLILALLKYLRSDKPTQGQAAVCRSLGEAIKGHRNRCNMTQEFVADALGVSRQAVSKWENGSSDPSTANLLALAKLFEISATEFLRDVEA